MSESVYRELKRVALSLNMSMKEVIEAAIRHFLAREQEVNVGFVLKDGSFEGSGLQEGVAEGNWNQIRSLIYEKQGG